MVRRWQFSSQVTFYSKVPLMGAHSAFKRLTESVTKGVTEATGETLKYELASFAISYDQLTRKHALGNFSIQRRDNTPFSENKYFSDAPLPTDIHIRLLEQFEADLLAK